MAKVATRRVALDLIQALAAAGRGVGVQYVFTEGSVVVGQLFAAGVGEENVRAQRIGILSAAATCAVSTDCPF